MLHFTGILVASKKLFQNYLKQMTFKPKQKFPIPILYQIWSTEETKPRCNSFCRNLQNRFTKYESPNFLKQSIHAVNHRRSTPYKNLHESTHIKPAEKPFPTNIGLTDTLFTISKLPVKFEPASTMSSSRKILGRLR